jgi:hypothetical protein
VGEGLVLVERLGARVKDPIDVFDAAGRKIRSLTDGVWDGTDGAGCAVASGVYLSRLTGGGEGSTRKMMLIR